MPILSWWMYLLAVILLVLASFRVPWRTTDPSGRRVSLATLAAAIVLAAYFVVPELT